MGAAAPTDATPHAVATYLLELRRPLAEATNHRQMWVQRIGILMEDARGGNPLTITQSAGQIGREHGGNFRRVRAQLDQLDPPASCLGVHSALRRWLANLIESCDLLVSVARDGDIARLCETESLFSDGRRHAHMFNQEYARVVARLRERVAHRRDRARPAEVPAGRWAAARESGPRHRRPLATGHRRR